MIRGRSGGPRSYIDSVDHSALLIEYLDTDLPHLDREPASAGADTLPAWGEAAKTEIAAPSFSQLRREQDDDIDIEVERAVEGALVEHNTSDSLEIDLLYLEPSSEASEASEPAELEIAIDIDLVADEESLHLDVAIARNSDSHIWESLDGEYGVFLATYQTLAIGTQVRLTVHLLDRTFDTTATVRWVRNENTGVWPGLGLELDAVSDAFAVAIARFAQIRPAMFHCF